MMGYIPPPYKPVVPEPIPVGDASPTDVRAGKSFAGPDGTTILGSLPERSTGPLTITPGVGAKTNPAGIYGGDIIVPGDAALIATNIRSGSSIYGVAGSFAGVIAPGNNPIWRRVNYINSNQSTPYEVVTIVFSMPGTIRISFDLYTSSTNARAQIYKNGSPFGTLRSSSSSTPTTYTQDITFVAGDQISVYLWALGSSASLEKITYSSNLLTIVKE